MLNILQATYDAFETFGLGEIILAWGYVSQLSNSSFSTSYSFSCLFPIRVLSALAMESEDRVMRSVSYVTRRLLRNEAN